MTVVKVQRPFVHSGRKPWPVLIYAEDRTLMVEQHLSKDESAAMRDDVKAYFDAEWCGKAGWKLGKRVAEQSW